MDTVKALSLTATAARETYARNQAQYVFRLLRQMLEQSAARFIEFERDDAALTNREFTGPENPDDLIRSIAELRVQDFATTNAQRKCLLRECKGDCPHIVSLLLCSDLDLQRNARDCLREREAYEQRAAEQPDTSDVSSAQFFMMPSEFARRFFRHIFGGDTLGPEEDDAEGAQDKPRKPNIGRKPKRPDAKKRKPLLPDSDTIEPPSDEAAD